MGRKQKIKKERREQAAGIKKPKLTPTRPGKIRKGWILAVVGTLAALIIVGVVMFVQHQNRLYQLAILAQTYDVEDKLKVKIGRFGTEDGNQLESFLREIHEVGNTPKLDAMAAGQLKFLLGVIDEIVRDGSVENGEFEKIRTQLDAVRQYLAKAERRKSTAP
jgi:hypothetical protein